MNEPTSPEERERRRRRREVQRQLDDALADSFPASDPVSIVTSQGEEWDEETPPPEDQKSPPKP
ncbi:MAG: hypothetical protein JSR36_12385 [Proteobacteria bacterium]|nr:hypothetical protein [Pseudomonadota bacterium]